MATISFTVPDAILAKVVSEFAVAYEYDTYKQLNETENQFTRRLMVATIKQKIAEGHMIFLGREEAAAANVLQATNPPIDTEQVV